MEFLVTMTTHVPDGTATDTVDEVRTREAKHSRELVREGHLLRLWLAAPDFADGIVALRQGHQRAS